MLILLALFTLAPPLQAQLDEVLSLYGVQEQVAQIPAQILAQIESYHEEKDEETLEVLRDVLPRAFSEESLMSTVRETFYGEADGHDVTISLEWLRGPVAARIAELNAEAARPEAFEDMRRYLEEAAAEASDSERLRLLEDLDEAAQVTESGIRLVLAMARSTAQGVGHLAPPGQQISEEALASQLEQIEKQLRPALRQNTKYLLLFKFRSLQENEIRQYVEFSRSAEGQWLQEAVLKSLVEALLRAGDETGRLIDQIKERSSG